METARRPSREAIGLGCNVAWTLEPWSPSATDGVVPTTGITAAR